MHNLANRHRGDLGGRLSHERAPARVRVQVSDDVAATPCGQHLTWMLVNLLARQADEVAALDLAIPRGIPIVQPLSPLVPAGTDLLTALREGVKRINPGVLQPGGECRSRVAIRVGPGPLDEADLALNASALGWAGYVGQEPATTVGPDDNPVGAYVAACLCAGEAFKYIRSMRADSGTFATRLWLDGFTLRLSRDALPYRPVPPSIALPATILAGVGAVGNGFLHTLYAMPGLHGDIVLIDHDPDGIDVTNLNRYALFGLPHVGAAKASTAAALLDNGRLTVHPVDASWQAWRMRHPDHPLPLVISAVDKNVARHAIQDALPRLMLGASTDGMRAQVNLYDPAQGGPCLRCRNNPETPVPDSEVIEHLRHLTSEERAREAGCVGIDVATLNTFLANPQAHCGMVTGAALQKFRGGSDEVQWAVGFVSLLAGVVLAAAYLARCIDPASAPLGMRHNTFRFQFWRPDKATVNTTAATPPDHSCLCQSRLFQHAYSQVLPHLG